MPHPCRGGGGGEGGDDECGGSIHWRPQRPIAEFSVNAKKTGILQSADFCKADLATLLTEALLNLA